jgi:hypothetical protein
MVSVVSRPAVRRGCAAVPSARESEDMLGFGGKWGGCGVHAQCETKARGERGRICNAEAEFVGVVKLVAAEGRNMKCKSRVKRGKRLRWVVNKGGQADIKQQQRPGESSLPRGDGGRVAGGVWK